MGTSQSTIARLESGTAKPSLSTLERFAQATGRAFVSRSNLPRSHGSDGRGELNTADPQDKEKAAEPSHLDSAASLVARGRNAGLNTAIEEGCGVAHRRGPGRCLPVQPSGSRAF
jgi:transcriptional regulator with XRE-family HTH domain